jgi:ketosteroid isomerase-like protein
VVGFAAGRAVDQQPSLSGSLVGIASALRSPSAPPAASSNAAPPAASSNAAPPVANANPAPPAPRANPAPPATGGDAAQRGNAGRPGTGNNGAPPAGASNAPSSDVQSALQQTIQSVDDAQVKAVATRDVSGLAANATAEFATQQKAVTQDLIDNGVTEIKLVNIEWGPITVNGNTATVTAFETWSTTFANGRTVQSRDRNVYTLVQQDGTWKVQTDEHPDALPGLPDGGNGVPRIPDNLLPPGFPNPFQNPNPNPVPRAPAGGVHA